MGQCCCAGSRIFVQEGIYDEFVKRSAARAKSRVVCDPWEAKCEQGKFKSTESKLQTQVILFLKSLSERGRHRTTQNRLKMASFKFRVVLCRIRLVPTMISKIK